MSPFRILSDTAIPRRRKPASAPHRLTQTEEWVAFAAAFARDVVARREQKGSK